MRITREVLRLWDACYTDEKIASFVPEEGLAPLEIAALDIPEEDRLWVLLREELVPAMELRLLACGWAESACRKACWNDERSMNAIAVARRYAVGEATEAERESAAAAAWAAWSEAWASARSAWSARAAAAESSAWAAREAAAEAAWAARSAAAKARSASAKARSAAAEEARSAQLADVVQVIERLNEAAQAGTEAK